MNLTEHLKAAWLLAVTNQRSTHKMFVFQPNSLICGVKFALARLRMVLFNLILLVGVKAHGDIALSQVSSEETHQPHRVTIEVAEFEQVRQMLRFIQHHTTYTTDI